MQIIADLHLHSKYSRAVSPKLTLEAIARGAARKGIDLVTTADCIHPAWFQMLQTQLQEIREGVYQLKNGVKTDFVIGTEVACIYTENGLGRRIHLILLLPSLEVAEKVNTSLAQGGVNLVSDGRPMVLQNVVWLCDLLWEIDPRIEIIPAHIWTPWFGALGSKTGFDSLRETFGKYAEKIHAVETGLSSDPLMNWTVRDIIKRAIVSFSDAHSAEKIGREATLMTLPLNWNFRDVTSAFGGTKNTGVMATIEYYPEEGKYFADGHRKCGIVQSAAETKRLGSICPVCGRGLTKGVAGRIATLADRTSEAVELEDESGVVWHHPKDGVGKPYIHLLSLRETVAQTLGVGANTRKVDGVLEKLVTKIGSELTVLLKTPLTTIEAIGGERLAEAVSRVRKGEIITTAGYDGVFGTVSVWNQPKVIHQSQEQLRVF